MYVRISMHNSSINIILQHQNLMLKKMHAHAVQDEIINWQGVNFGNWRFWIKSPIFYQPMIFLHRYMFACM